MTSLVTQKQKRQKIIRASWTEIKIYPVHNFNSIIWTWLIIIFQCIKLVLHGFFCTKLQRKFNKDDHILSCLVIIIIITIIIINKRTSTANLQGQKVTFSLGPKGLFLRDSSLQSK